MTLTVISVLNCNAQVPNKMVVTKAIPKIGTVFLPKATLKMTTFNPAIHNFKFANTFQGVDSSHRYGGLCGGMVYAALDYYYANMQIPQQTYAPSNRYPLHSFIYNRQANSAQESNADRWAELGVNPGGIRNSEFFGWGILMRNAGDRMNELKTMIDSGKPAPMGLFHSDEVERHGYYKGGDHQVLAIGYDFGKYKGDEGTFLDDFKIYVSDPNYPGQIMTMKANAVHKCFYYEEGNRDAWLTYFVNSKYTKVTPPAVANLDNNRTLYAKIGTGHDNLRGGNDNLAITLVYRDGTRQSFPNVNISATWIPDYTEVVPLVLNRFINNNSDIAQIIFNCSFGGGFDGENWDMKSLKITKSRENDVLFEREGSIPRDGHMIVKRFTGNDKTIIFNIN